MATLRLVSWALVALSAVGCPATSGGPGSPRRADAVSGKGGGSRRAVAPPIKDAHFAAGVRLLRRRPTPDYEGARQAFRRLLQAQPKHLAALLNVGYCSLHLGQLHQARRAYAKAFALRPGHEGARQGLVNVLMRSGKAAEALRILDTHLGRHPRDLPALGLAADAHLALNQWDRALARVQQALAIDRRDALAHLCFGRLYLAKGDSRTALMIYGRGLRLQPKSAILHFGRAQAWMKAGEMGRAVMDFERAARLDPNHVATRLNLGKVYVDNLDYKGALEHFGRVLQRWPRDRAALMGKARALFGLRRFKEALAGYQAALRHHGQVPAALFQIAKIYQDHLDKPLQALYYYRKFVGASKGLSPGDPVHATIRMLQATSRPAPRRAPPRRRGAGGIRP